MAIRIGVHGARPQRVAGEGDGMEVGTVVVGRCAPGTRLDGVGDLAREQGLHAPEG